MTRDEAVDAYLAVFAVDGFAVATIDHVARASGATPAALVAAVGDRWAALDAFTRRLDLAGVAAADASGSVRDRLFDLTMARFDAATPHRAALVALDAEARRRPALAAALLMSLPRTAALLLSAAGVNTIGLVGSARAQAFAALLGEVGQTWLRDDDADQGATMRKLDARLDQAERLMERFGSARGAAEPELPRGGDTAAV